MVQWEKLISLHRILSESKSYLTVNELTGKLDCSESTILMLIKILREKFNAPLVLSEKYNGYKYIPTIDNEAFELPGLWFRTEELEALAHLESIAGSLQYGYLSDEFTAFKKRVETLLVAQNISLKAWEERFKIIPVVSRKPDRIVFSAICDAVLHGKQLIITHQKSRNTISETLIISPQKFLRYKDCWYIDFWCHKSAARRTFSLNRISHAELLKIDGKAMPRELLENGSSGYDGILPRASKKIAEIVFYNYAVCEAVQEELHPEQQLLVNSDNTFTLKIPYSDSDEIIKSILRWGDNAEVTGPEELRREVRVALENTLKRYCLEVEENARGDYLSPKSAKNT
jgi:predicted DNA-binding transcriptional regulator YafY